MVLPPDLLAKLERLRIATRRVHSGRFAARTRSRKLGAGIDFADHRAYTPGDDLKYVDWTLFGRLDQLMIRLSEEETELDVHLLVDVSRSMKLGVGEDPADSKAEVARLAATALAYVALSNLDQVRVWPFATQLGRPLVTARKRSEVVRVWRHLGEADLGKTTDLDVAITRFLQLSRQRGVVILISDLWMDEPLKPLDRLLHERYDVGVVQLLRPSEVQLPLRGARFDLVDGETGQVLREVSRSQVEAVAASLPARQKAIAEGLRRRGIPYVSTQTGDPTDLEHLVLHLFRERRLVR